MFRIILISRLSLSSRWRHNGRDGVSNHQPHDYLLNRLFRHRSKKTAKLRVTGLCEGNSPGTGEFPAQMASNAENVSIWWRHHGYSRSYVGARDMNKVFHNNPYAWWLSGIPSTAHLKQYAPCVVLVKNFVVVIVLGTESITTATRSRTQLYAYLWTVSRMECSHLWYICWKKYYMPTRTVRLERPWLFMIMKISVIKKTLI